MQLDTDRCWQILRNREVTADFFVGVLSTKIFCRTNCPSRPPKPENVRFFATTTEAQAAGLRACLRCRPLAAVGLDPNTERVRELCAFIEQHAAEPLSLAALGERAGLSPFHLQRSFKAIVGVTPKQYVDDCRMARLKSHLREQREVTEAIFEAGYGSLSRVYEKTDARLGMTPMEYRSGGAGVNITYAETGTPLGPMLVGATDRGLCFLQFGEGLLDALRREYPRAVLTPMTTPAPASFGEWMASLNAYLAGTAPDLRLPVHVRATAFQMKVWRYLQSIPAGGVASYAEVAREMGEPKAVRAVARACASNAVALAIPCHRVIRGTGELGGYRWGVERKRVLLDQERRLRG
jgi:AraC family transcriptional regulator, regulatory protein of adaptative response / methylated-DNA-[protein]-cysteine methyltransferase